jgi:hypothetical protein
MHPGLRGQFGESVAARSLKLAADTFEPAVVERVVGFLGDLAADGAALEDPVERIHGGRRLIVGRHRPLAALVANVVHAVPERLHSILELE